MDKYLDCVSRSTVALETRASMAGDESTTTPRGEGRDTLPTVVHFADMGLITPLLDALNRLGHVEPTPIQRKAILPALAGRDVLGCAQTGTGKTAAFTLPLLQRLSIQEPRSNERGRPSNNRSVAVRALVLSPTRELAAQIAESLGEYGKLCRIKHAMVCGGVGIGGQIQALRRGVDVLVATPGRLEDLMTQGVVDLSAVEVLVLDEVDRMLDQGFLPAVRRISSRIPKSRQTLLFSATMPRELRNLALVLMSNPVEVAADQIASTPTAIEQMVYHVATQLKRTLLEQLVNETDMSRVLVFTRTKHGADRVAKHLKAAKIGADALHGGKTQSSRERALAGFRDGKLRVLVATDLAARGIHVDGISHVINFDLPVDADNYVHRIGRTARAGSSGIALSLCSDEEREVLRRIEKLIRRRLTVAQTPRLHPVVEKKAYSPSNHDTRTMANDVVFEKKAYSPSNRDTRASSSYPAANQGARPRGRRPAPDRRFGNYLPNR
jgi:ATP-dependent RNA helicase RhlE